MKWINKHLEKIALTSVILAALWVLFGPILLTQTGICIADFSDNENNTGLIGDTIGGITAPVVGLISAVLLYLALLKQIENNNITVHEANFRILYEEINKLRTDSERYSFDNKYGIEAIGTFSARFGVRNQLSQLADGDFSVLDTFDLLLNKFHRIFYLLDNLKTSDEYKDILSNDLQHLYAIYFNDSCGIMQGWDVSRDDIDLIKSKMFMVQDNLRIIRDDILRRNRG